MSKFIDKMKSIPDTAQQPMGFRITSTRQQKLHLAIMAAIPYSKLELLDSIAPDKVDSIVITSLPALPTEVGTNLTGTKLSGNKMTIAWGLASPELPAAELRSFIESGCDFLLLNPDTAPASLLFDDKIGKIVEVSPALQDSILRIIQTLNIDAVVLKDSPELPLTINTMSEIRRIAMLTGKLLMVKLPVGVDITDIRVLRDAGVTGLILSVTDQQSLEYLNNIKEIISKLPPIKKRPEKREVMLPLATVEQEELAEEE